MNILDITIIILLNILLISLLLSEYKLIGLDKPLVNIPTIFLTILQFVLLPLLILDIYLKYRKVRDVRLFLKKHYLEVIMLLLFPVFVIFKFIKLTLKIYKIISMSKIGKTIAKISLGMKKLLK